MSHHHRSSRYRNRRRPERQEAAAARQTLRDTRTDYDQAMVLAQRGHSHCAEAKGLLR